MSSLIYDSQNDEYSISTSRLLCDSVSEEESSEEPLNEEDFLNNSPRTITDHRKKQKNFQDNEANKKRRIKGNFMQCDCDSESLRVIRNGLPGRFINEEKREKLNILNQNKIKDHRRRISELCKELIFTEDKNIKERLQEIMNNFKIQLKITKKGEAKYFIRGGRQNEKKKERELGAARYALEKIRNPQYNTPHHIEEDDCEDEWKMLQTLYVKECQYRCETRKVFPFFYQVVDSSNNYRKSKGNPMKFWDDKDYEGSDYEVSIKEKYIKHIEKYLNRLKNAKKMPYNLDLEKIEVRKTELKDYFSFELKKIYNLLGNWKVEKALPGYWEGKKHECCACIDIYDEATKQSEHFKEMYVRGKLRSRCVCSKLVEYGFAKQSNSLVQEMLQAEETTAEEMAIQDTDFSSDGGDSSDWGDVSDIIDTTQNIDTSQKKQNSGTNFEEESDYDAGF